MGDGLGEGDGVVGIDVMVALAGVVGGEGVEGDLLDGAVGVEEDGGDGVVGAGARVEEGAGGGGTSGEGCWKTCLRRAVTSRLLGVTSVGEAGGVELAAGMGSEEGGEDPEGGEGGGELEVEDPGARGKGGFGGRRGPGRRSR